MTGNAAPLDALEKVTAATLANLLTNGTSVNDVLLDLTKDLEIS